MRVALFLLAATACGSAGEPGPDAAAAAPDPDLDDTAAAVEVTLRTYDDGSGGVSFVAARLFTEPPPWPYDVEPVVGACRWSGRQPEACTEPCDLGASCIGTVCVPPPTGRSAGTLTVSAGGASHSLPFGAAGYQLYDDRLLFAPGATLTAAAPGAEVAAFSLSTVVPRPLTVVGAEQLRLRAGNPLVVRWTPADPGARVRLTLGADRGHAQLRAALVECDAPDEAGAITVPQALVDRFADPALWGCGDCFPHELRRYRRARGTAGALPLSLWVSQATSLYLVPER